MTLSNIDSRIKTGITIFDNRKKRECDDMPREKFRTLTEQMFYILMCLRTEMCGMDIMERVASMTKGRVLVGPGTLYNLLEQFAEADMIRETRAEGRRRSYILTAKGKEALEAEYARLRTMAGDYERIFGGMNGNCEKKSE